jgi:peptidoglycan/LPS O-acetylase OafA/YrhL
MQLQFRADIDYLRAIAVVSVIGFHYGIPGFGGGFIGVDIFFVISGYLISRLIWSGLHADSFSFWQFYDRRARRLLPALYVMIAITGVAAWFLAPPADYRTFFGSAVATLLFSSNIFFWFNSSYFELPTIGKVLIHTWSVESSSTSSFRWRRGCGANAFATRPRACRLRYCSPAPWRCARRMSC